MAKIKTFPKQIAVTIDDAYDEDDYLTAYADTTMVGVAEIGVKKKVAIYQLAELREVEGVVTSNIVQRHKK